MCGDSPGSANAAARYRFYRTDVPASNYTIHNVFFLIDDPPMFQRAQIWYD